MNEAQTSDIRVDHEAREHLLRLAAAVVDSTGVHITSGRIRKLVARYRLQVQRNGWAFVDYFANALCLSEHEQRRLRADPELLKVIEYADPTGETAVRNVMQQSQQQTAC